MKSVSVNRDGTQYASETRKPVASSDGSQPHAKAAAAAAASPDDRSGLRRPTPEGAGAVPGAGAWAGEEARVGGPPPAWCAACGSRQGEPRRKLASPAKEPASGWADGRCEACSSCPGPPLDAGTAAAACLEHLPIGTPTHRPGPATPPQPSLPPHSQSQSPSSRGAKAQPPPPSSSSSAARATQSPAAEHPENETRQCFSVVKDCSAGWLPQCARRAVIQTVTERDTFTISPPLARSSIFFPSPSTTPLPVVAPRPSCRRRLTSSRSCRAAQKLSLTGRMMKRKQRAAPPHAPAEPPPSPGSFAWALRSAAPPVPPCLLRAAGKARDNPGAGKVKVMLRVCPARRDASGSAALKVDPRRKQVTLYDPAAAAGASSQNAALRRAGVAVPKIFPFDAVFSQDASQAEVCAGAVPEIIQSVVNGADGCIFCFGNAKLGKTYTMLGSGDSSQALGVAPCAISWLFRLIEERKERTGARFSVRVSAVEVSGRGEALDDLLSDVASGTTQDDNQSPGVFLREDPVCGTQLENQNELRASTAERAAGFLDAAVAARRGGAADASEEDRRNSHMLFTLHVYQYRMERGGRGGMTGGRSRLHLMDLGSCEKVLCKSREPGSGMCLSLSALGSVLLALANGAKHIPYRESRLTMLLQESLGNINCRTTMIAHVSASAARHAETLATVQLAARVHRLRKKKSRSASSSSGGDSSCEEGRGHRGPAPIRPFHPRLMALDPEPPPPVGSPGMRPPHRLGLASEAEYSSSSEQSCDTVIYAGEGGDLTDNEGPPESVPVSPASSSNSANSANSSANSAASSPANPLDRDHFKCKTFAELQERLDCIDGSEEPGCFAFVEASAATVAEEERKADGRGVSAGSPWHAEDEPAKDNNNEAPASPCALGNGCKARGKGECVSSEVSADKINRNEIPSCGSGAGKAPGGGLACVPIALPLAPGGERGGKLGSPEKRATGKRSLPSPAPPPPQCRGTESTACRAHAAGGLRTRTPPVGMSPQVAKRVLAPQRPSPAADAEGGVEADVPPACVDGPFAAEKTAHRLDEESGTDDELVFTLDLLHALLGGGDGSGNNNSTGGNGGNGRRPISIISFTSNCSTRALAPGSRPVSFVSVDFEPYSPPPPLADTGAGAAAPAVSPPHSNGSNSSCRSSIGSWLSELSNAGSLGSEGEQSCDSFVVQAILSAKHGEDDLENHKKQSVFPCPASGAQVVAGGGVKIQPAVIRSGISVHPRITPKPAVALLEKVPSRGTPGSPARQSPKAKNCDGCIKPPEPRSTFENPWVMREHGEMDGLEESTNVSHGKPADVCTSAGTAAESPAQSNGSSQAPGGQGISSDALRAGGEMQGVDRVSGGGVGGGGYGGYSHTLPTKASAHGKSSAMHGIVRLGNGEATSLDREQVATVHSATMDRKKGAAKSSGGCAGGGTANVFLFSKLRSSTPPAPPVRKSSLDQRNRAGCKDSPGANHAFSYADTEEAFSRLLSPSRGGSGGGSNCSTPARGKLELSAEQGFKRSFTGRSDSTERTGSRKHAADAKMLTDGHGCVAHANSASSRLGRLMFRISGNGGSSAHSTLAQEALIAHTKLAAELCSKSSSVFGSKNRSQSANGGPPPAKAAPLSPLSPSSSSSSSSKTLPHPGSTRSSSLPASSRAATLSRSVQALRSKLGRGTSESSSKAGRATNSRVSELACGSPKARGLLPTVADSDSGNDSGVQLTDEKPPPAGSAAAGGAPASPSAASSSSTGAGAASSSAVKLALPSPYSKVTAPRRPHHRSSGHGSDTSSVLSGEMPPAMGSAALFYCQNVGGGGGMGVKPGCGLAGGGSGGGGSVAGVVAPIRRALRSQRRRLAHQPHPAAPPTLPPVDVPPCVPPCVSPCVSPARKAPAPPPRRADPRPAQRVLNEPFEIKIYEIDGVQAELLVYFSDRLKRVEERHQRLAEVQDRYLALRLELEASMRHLMIEPSKWIAEFEVDGELDEASLEYLDCLERATERLQQRLNVCKSHIMIITCFDATR
ncbi:unnamed protein product [Lampetra planeri]